MTKVNQNFTLRRERKRLIRVTVRDLEQASSGDPPVFPVKDLTGAAITWVMRVNAEASSDLISKSLIDGIALEGAATLGVYIITIDAEDTESIENGRYFHEDMIIDSDDDVATSMTGFVAVVETAQSPPSPRT